MTAEATGYGSLVVAPPDVVWWTGDQGGTRYYRCEQPAMALAGAGYRTLVTRVLYPSIIGTPTLVGHRVASTRGTRLWQHRAALRDTGSGQMLVYDADDDYFHVDQSNEQAWPIYSKPSVRDDIRRNMAAADLVTVCSDHLADLYRPYARRIEVTSNTICADVARWTRPRGDEITIGWAGSAAGHADLDLIAEVLRDLARCDGTRIHLIGLPAHLGRRKRLDVDGITITPWVTGTEAYLMAIDFDLWLCPLRDIPFNRGKFPTKVMEAACLGIPLVVSAVGAYRDHAGRPGVTVVRENTGTAWRGAITETLSDLGRYVPPADVGGWYTECNSPRWERLLCHTRGPRTS